ncbi:MAG: hypothetical protein K2X87_07770 [Gemmataceae bacterium]|nr:hypothetical protein [Gemmataceae bacterium]
MTLTLWIVAAAAVTLIAAYVVSSNSDVHAVLAGDHPVAPDLAGENTLVGLTDPAAETLSGGAARRPKADWGMATMASLTEAEQCLDWAENRGFAERELVVLGNTSFAVRWR